VHHSHLYYELGTVHAIASKDINCLPCLNNTSKKSSRLNEAEVIAMHNARVRNLNGFKFMVVLVGVETWQYKPLTAKHALFIQWKMMAAVMLTGVKLESSRKSRTTIIPLYIAVLCVAPQILPHLPHDLS
jgi:hypothetical protein